MELRGRRREHKRTGARSRFYMLGGRRAHISFLAARRLMPSINADARHPQLIDDADHNSAGDVAGDLLTVGDRPETTRMHAAPALKRAITLTSDAIVLTLASPFFAVWWIVRAVRKRR